MIKKILEAGEALFCFQPYTNMPRWMEIGYGILAWFGVVTIIYAIV